MNASGASAGTLTETTGSTANTWTDYLNAGGTEGPQIGSNQSVQITCVVTGFKVADGNTAWYEIGSSPWNNEYYVSADAFYNNGATSGSLIGTPFVDPSVPSCTSLTTTTATSPPPQGASETTGSTASTWTNYLDAGGTEGPQISSNATINVTCRLTGFAVSDGNTWWYEIGSSPWNNEYYVSADAFYNNGATSGSLIGTPFYDSAVPVCGGGGGGSGGNKPEPTVTLTEGPPAVAGYEYAITLSNFSAEQTVTIECFDSASPSGFYIFSLTTNSSGDASTASYCYSGDGPEHWVTASGIESNIVTWGSGTVATPTLPPSNPGGSSSSASAPASITASVIRGTINPDPNSAASVSLVITVKNHAGGAVSGAAVIARGPNWSAKATTNSQGSATLTVPVNQAIAGASVVATASEAGVSVSEHLVPYQTSLVGECQFPGAATQLDGLSGLLDYLLPTAQFGDAVSSLLSIVGAADDGIGSLQTDHTVVEGLKYTHSGMSAVYQLNVEVQSESGHVLNESRAFSSHFSTIRFTTGSGGDGSVGSQIMRRLDCGVIA